LRINAYSILRDLEQPSAWAISPSTIISQSAEITPMQVTTKASATHVGMGVGFIDWLGLSKLVR
jgi:hypothetical protein